MRLRRLRKECEARLSGLPVPRPFDVRAFCEHVAQWRGRPLHLHELPVDDVADLPCGMWIATDHADHVFHLPGGSSLHRDHIVLHEIGHMLFDHTVAAESSDEPDALDRLLPDLDPAMVRRVLRRGGYSTEQERAAEMMASLILQRAATAAPAGLDEVFGRARRADAVLAETSGR
ncbi:hypothetical protein [Hamadaea sp.]|uniref:hypothetical protein n=1 Tax=Hamadaea sp. TaxID=2024425 RepID=UPI0025C66586|nr:hypothetical protein [Hamadaea sp.]